MVIVDLLTSQGYITLSLDLGIRPTSNIGEKFEEQDWFNGKHFEFS